MVSKRRVVTQHVGLAEPNYLESNRNTEKPYSVPSNSADKQANAPTRMESYLNQVAPVVLAVTYWFDPPPGADASSYTIRISAKRLNVTGRRQPADQVIHEVTVNGIVTGCGPVAVMAKIQGINPGTWEVSAKIVTTSDSGFRQKERQGKTTEMVPPVYRSAWSWRKWSLRAASSTPIETCLAPFAKPPAVIIGSWAVFVASGIVAAVGTQFWVVDLLKLDPARVLIASVTGIIAGAIGGKLWFVILHLREKRLEGWCLQGMVAGIAVVFPALLAMLNLPVATILDASTPGIMLGLAIGRLGCFFTGCCAGRPTASKWGLWSSDRIVGMRRIPTQLMESGLALLLSVIIFASIYFEKTFNGALFVAALSAYTLVRQGLLQLRLERRNSRFGSPLTAIAAAIVLVGTLVLAITGW